MSFHVRNFGWLDGWERYTMQEKELNRTGASDQVRLNAKDLQRCDKLASTLEREYGFEVFQKTKRNHFYYWDYGIHMTGFPVQELMEYFRWEWEVRAPIGELTITYLSRLLHDPHIYSGSLENSGYGARQDAIFLLERMVQKFKAISANGDYAPRSDKTYRDYESNMPVRSASGYGLNPDLKKLYCTIKEFTVKYHNSLVRSHGSPSGYSDCSSCGPSDRGMMLILYPLVSTEIVKKSKVVIPRFAIGDLKFVEGWNCRHSMVDRDRDQWNGY